MPKISAKFEGHPLRGRQMQVGWVKIGDFRQITGYISKTVQDRRMLSIKVEQEVCEKCVIVGTIMRFIFWDRLVTACQKVIKIYV